MIRKKRCPMWTAETRARYERKGLRATQGIYHYEPMRPDRFETLERLVTGDGRPLPPRLAAEIRRHLVRLELVLEMIREVEAERDRLAKAAARSPKCEGKLIGQGAAA